MLGKKARPVIGNLITGASGPGYKSGVYDVSAAATSPRSPLDFIKIQSPRGLKNFGAVGVGLGIVAALEKTSEIEIQSPAKRALFHRNSSRSSPIPVSSAQKRGELLEKMERDSLEDYTYVTFHGPNKKSQTRVYYDGCEKNRGGVDRNGTKIHRACVFDISPATPSSSAAEFPVNSDFLSSCHMCQKKLDGEDIYMYRGEKAFCSTECRYKQIVMDEKKEKKCSTQASSRSLADVSNSYSNNGHQMFTNGIFVI